MSAAVEISCQRWAALNVSTVQQAKGLMKLAPIENFRSRAFGRAACVTEWGGGVGHVSGSNERNQRVLTGVTEMVIRNGVHVAETKYLLELSKSTAAST